MILYIKNIKKYINHPFDNQLSNSTRSINIAFDFLDNFLLLKKYHRLFLTYIYQLCFPFVHKYQTILTYTMYNNFPMDYEKNTEIIRISNSIYPRALLSSVIHVTGFNIDYIRFLIIHKLFNISFLIKNGYHVSYIYEYAPDIIITCYQNNIIGKDELNHILLNLFYNRSAITLSENIDVIKEQSLYDKSLEFLMTFLIEKKIYLPAFNTEPRIKNKILKLISKQI